MILNPEIPPFPACGSTEPDCEPDCVAAPPRQGETLALLERLIAWNTRQAKEVAEQEPATPREAEIRNIRFVAYDTARSDLEAVKRELEREAS